VVFPTAPVLRGEEPSALAFPRGRVLAAAPDSAPTSGGLHHPLLFELAPEVEAERYRVELRRTDGGAFDAGREVATIEGTGPVLALADARGGAPALEPGDYTWEAWAVVRGLERFLGRRDFALVDDAALRSELARLAALPEPRRSSAALALLCARGFPGDARAWARSLPASPERDRFLEELPGR